jgi:hypothetical protein
MYGETYTEEATTVEVEKLLLLAVLEFDSKEINFVGDFCCGILHLRLYFCLELLHCGLEVRHSRFGVRGPVIG